MRCERDGYAGETRRHQGGHDLGRAHERRIALREHLLGLMAAHVKERVANSLADLGHAVVSAFDERPHNPAHLPLAGHGRVGGNEHSVGLAGDGPVEERPEVSKYSKRILVTATRLPTALSWWQRSARIIAQRSRAEARDCCGGSFIPLSSHTQSHAECCTAAASRLQDECDKAPAERAHGPHGKSCLD